MNDDNDIIQFIVEKLNLYPEINYNNHIKDKLSIFTNYDNGFNIILYSDELGSTLYLDDFHIHFEHTDHDITTLIHLIFHALIGKVKLEIFYKNDHPYKYNIQTLNANGDWCIYKTMQAFFYKFWQKTSCKQLQNHYVAEFLSINHDLVT